MIHNGFVRKTAAAKEREVGKWLGGLNVCFEFKVYSQCAQNTTGVKQYIEILILKALSNNEVISTII